MKKKCILLFMIISTAMFAQNEEALAFAKAKSYQEKLNARYSNPGSTILSKAQLRTFKGLKFWPIDMKYRVEASFVYTPEALPFDMSSSTGHTNEYVQYGVATFTIDDKEFKLPIYQYGHYIDHPEVNHSDDLFLPFTDYTSGDGSYGGGRYIGLKQGDIIDQKVVIDFNLAYNPYCAYTARYSCAIPPEANDLKYRIEAGVKYDKKEH